MGRREFVSAEGWLTLVSRITGEVESIGKWLLFLAVSIQMRANGRAACRAWRAGRPLLAAVPARRVKPGEQ